MGGYGSGRPSRHYTVEQCQRLTLSDVQQRLGGPVAARMSVRISHDDRMGYFVGIACSATGGGGLRLWLSCPALRCGRRCAILYRPPGGDVFACRQCWRLTYRSCKDSDKRITAMRHSAERIDAVMSAAHAGSFIAMKLILTYFDRRRRAIEKQLMQAAARPRRKKLKKRQRANV